MTAPQSIYQPAGQSAPDNGHPAWPVCSAIQDVYSVRYETISFEFDYLSPDRDGGIWAEMEVVCTLPGIEGPLLRSRINLLKGNSRREAVRDLTSRAKNMNLDWESMIEEASYWVVNRMRRGDGALILRDVDETQTAGGMLLPPLLVEDGSTILFGPGGGAKSFLALAAGLSLHTGTEVIKGLVPARQQRVAYCDWEWSPAVHKRRMRRLWPDGELPDLVYIKGRLPITEERDRLRHLIREHQIDYLIIDSVVEAADDDPETANTARRFYGVLSSLNIHALLVAHVTKNETRSRGDTEAPFGSIFWSNAARSTWNIRPQDNPPPDTLNIGLYHRKPNEGPRQSPFALEFNFSDERVTIQRRAAIPSTPTNPKVPLKFRLIEALKGGAMQIWELAEELNESVDAVRMALKRGDPDTFLRRARPDGTYEWGLRNRPED